MPPDNPAALGQPGETYAPSTTVSRFARHTDSHLDCTLLVYTSQGPWSTPWNSWPARYRPSSISRAEKGDMTLYDSYPPLPARPVEGH